MFLGFTVDWLLDRFIHIHDHEIDNWLGLLEEVFVCLLFDQREQRFLHLGVLTEVLVLQPERVHEEIDRAVEDISGAHFVLAVEL